MMMYVYYYDRYEKLSEENSTVGILLCKERDDALVEITLLDDDNIYVLEYQLYLPDKKELQKKWIERGNGFADSSFWVPMCEVATKFLKLRRKSMNSENMITENP